MKFNILRKAFSLTELLIVLVVVAVLFAAMVPIMTKRGSGSTTGNESPWLYVRDDEQSNIYFDPGSASLTGTAFVGFNSAALADSSPLSKMVVKANYLQGMIQFRDGNDGDGEYSGIFFVDSPDVRNMIATTDLLKDVSSYGTGSSSGSCGSFCLLDKDNKIGTDGRKIGPHTNTVFGPNAASNVTWMTASTVAGADAAFGSRGKTVNAITNIGSKSNRYLASTVSTLVGANTGLNSSNSTTITSTLAVGSGVLGMPDSKSVANVYLGYNVARDGFSAENKNNVIVNSQYFGSDKNGNVKSSIKNSVIVGPKSYESGFQYVNNLTAIGYNACASFNPNNDNNNTLNGSTTCIGYNSAAVANGTKYLGWSQDNYDRVFLGGVSHGFGGRSVLEVHNMGEKQAPLVSALDVKPLLGPTVVLNSHLVVRGNLYIPSVETGEVQAMTFSEVWAEQPGSAEQGDDFCRRRRCWRRRRVYKDECDWWAIIAKFALTVVGALTGGLWAGIFSDSYIGSYLGGGIAGLITYTGLNLSAYDGASRSVDPSSASGVSYPYSANQPLARCSNVAGDHYFKHGRDAGFNSPCPQPLLSDVRLKENISENHIALSKLLMVQPYNYTFKMDKEAVPQVGVMAQDLEKFFPTAVFNNPSGYKSIRWDEMFFATVNSIKSLDDSVTKIEYDLVVMDDDTDKIAKDMKNVKNRIAGIEKRIKKLENK